MPNIYFERHLSSQINEELSQARHKIILNSRTDTCWGKAEHLINRRVLFTDSRN